jgi:hypothetical protein
MYSMKGYMGSLEPVVSSSAITSSPSVEGFWLGEQAKKIKEVMEKPRRIFLFIAAKLQA